MLRLWVASYTKRVECQCGCRGRHTLERVFEVVAWSLGCLLSGEHPSVRDDGVPFKDSKCRGDRRRARRAKERLKAKGGVVRMTGDWQFLNASLGFVGWFGETIKRLCCPLCRANMTDLPADDLALDAGWRTLLCIFGSKKKLLVQKENENVYGLFCVCISKHSSLSFCIQKLFTNYKP